MDGTRFRVTGTPGTAMGRLRRSRKRRRINAEVHAGWCSPRTSNPVEASCGELWQGVF